MFDTVETMKSFDPDWERGSGSAPVTLAFSMNSPADVDAKHAELVAAGGKSHMEPWDAFWGQHYAVVKDPDNNNIDLFAWLAKDEGDQ